MTLRILLFVSCLFIACRNEPEQEAVTQEVQVPVTENTKPDFNAGDLIERINCAGDASLTFALYLPHSYLPQQRLPVIIFFDPHGDGVYPLNKYKKLADHYGYMLIGSNDSKNGNNPQQTARIIESMLRSARSILNSDSNRIYTAGFSGGARVAAMMGLSPSGIQGIALSGAGFPSAQWYKLPPSVIIAMSGNSDMNLSEFLTLNPREDFQGRFQLIRFNGKHEWPPEEHFENAFMGFDCYAMRDKLKPVDKTILQHIDMRFRQQAAQLNVGGRLIESKLLYEAWIKDLNGLYDIAEVEKNYSNIISRPQYQMNNKNEGHLLAEELSLRKLYTEAIGKQDTTWWTNKMHALQQEVNTGKNRQRNEMLQRVQGYASLAIYSALSQSMRSNMLDTKSSSYLAAIYRTVDPENTEAWYLSALISALQANPAKAIEFLNRSVDNGFSDVNRTRTEAAFASISMNKEFEKTLERMHKNTARK